MKSNRYNNHLVCLLVSLFMLVPSVGLAYVGPGAGFALISSTFLFIVIFFTIIFSLLFWPVRALWAWVRRRKAAKRAKIRRLVILGLDGLDPKVVRKLMDAGKLPNFEKLASQGSFGPLATTCPPISPVAWSSFMTGCNPGRHSIYDFLSRDKNTYLPMLSSSKVQRNRRGKPSMRLLRKSQPFWSILGKQGVFSTVIRVPITFPPEKFNGLLLSGMCVPDILGTQGTFAYYSSEPEPSSETTGGKRYTVTRDGQTIQGVITGPDNPRSKERPALTIPFEVKPSGSGQAELSIQGNKYKLKIGEYSPWVRLSFSAGFRARVQGIARFLITGIEPEFSMYLSPINIDPQKPSLPISHPFAYSIYLAKRFAPYATLGLAEDTWALNESVIDDGAFLEQTYLNHQEREDMFFDSLKKQRRGLVVCVFDTTDRIQHMFWRYQNPDHPALEGKDRKVYANQIEELYCRMDRLLQKTMQKLGQGDELVVMSDHGFNDFSRGVNINTWLHQNGYLTLKQDARGDASWLKDVDWSRTRAYSIGMSCIYLNLKGRESQGIVEPDQEEQQLKQELIGKLAGLMDDQRKQMAVKHVWDRKQLYSGPYVGDAPDLTLGFCPGYRASWDSVQGKIGQDIIEDNRKAWSGDHCLDPATVPGVLFTSFRHKSDKPHIMDIAPTALSLLGAKAPAYIEGKALEPENSNEQGIPIRAQGG